VTIGECARHFGVSEDQLERDLWLLVVCGVPGYGPDQLVYIDFWDDGIIHVLDPQTLGRPLRLTHEEALSLLVALRMLAQLPGIEDRDAIVTAAAKIELLTSDSASERFVAVRLDVPAAVTSAVDAALASGSDLVIRYASATKDEVTDRTIQPRRLHVVDGVAYLEAYCLSAQAVRTFRLDRVISAAVSASTTTPEEPTVAEPSAGRRSAVLDLTPAGRWIIDVHHAEIESEGPDGVARVRLPLHSLDWGVRLVLSLHGAAVAVEPPDLVSAVVAAARAALSAYPDR
jgi:proteasome accessory factor C